VDVELQIFIDKFGCRYFVENDTNDGHVLNFALRATFVRLYALNRKAETVVSHRTRFQHNDRIQIFTWTHSESWDELIRLVPVEQPSVFWLHASELIASAIHSISRLRPAHRDILLVEPGVQRGAMIAVDRFFAGTHNIKSEYEGLFLLTPMKRRRRKN
jgi:hypothetical protein